MAENITIIGDGAMGTICSVMLAENGNRVRMWSAFPAQAEELNRLRENRRFLPGVELPDGIEITGDDETVFAGTDLVISAVPSQFVRPVWQRLAKPFDETIPVCSVAKGIENDTLMRPTEVLAEVLAPKRVKAAVLSGPSIAPEIAEKLPATVTVASEDRALAERIQHLISRPYFRVYTSEDITGVELAGAVKNVIAIAAGILDGMELGCNAKSALLARGLVEISRLGAAAGAREETFAGLSGMGDLVTTCISPVGRNRSFGESVGRGTSVREAMESTESVVEGIATTRSVVDLAGKLGVDMPITGAIFQVLFEDKSPNEAIADLMNRPLRSEDRK